MENNVVLSMKGICMTFPGVKALENVDFHLKKGEIRALMGENGAGKSTLIKCLTGVNKFEAGEIYLDGIEGSIVNKDTMDAQKKGISTVYQEVNLCPNLSVAENLFIGREPMTKIGTVNRKKMNAMAAKLMKDLDLDIDVTQNLEEYSLALQQMIAIARAVDMDCKVLILDEPSAGLDPAGRKSLLGNIRAYHRQTGATVVMVSHSMDEVAENVDRIVVLANAGVVMSGTPHEVFSRAQELIDVGLNVPQVTQVAMALARQGVEIDPAVYTVADLRRALNGLKGGRSGC